jgi:LysM repeat protein
MLVVGGIRMGLRIVRVTELPLGKRVLHQGDRGRDVRHLQKLLNETGFYFGAMDGSFGALTTEAVILLQRTFNLKVDGIVGPEVISLLIKTDAKSGRIIYTVKPGENLAQISQRFNVRKTAWKGLSGQGNPQKRIYPGMRLLLPEKMLYIWEQRPGIETPLPVTGEIQVNWSISAGGELSLGEESSQNPISHQLLKAETEVWAELMGNGKPRRTLVKELKKGKAQLSGLDLRKAPAETMLSWSGLLQYICSELQRSRMGFLALPMISGKHRIQQFYREVVSDIRRFTGLIIIDPQPLLEQPDLFEERYCQLRSELRAILAPHLQSRVLVMGRVGGWDWNMDQASCKEISYREARIIQAMYSRLARYSPESRLTTIHYQRQKEQHTLIYRNSEGWYEWLRMIAYSNLGGVVIQNFSELGGIGPEMIASTFAIAREPGR